MGFCASDQREDICSYSHTTGATEKPVAYVPQSEEVDWSFPVLVEDVVMMGRYGHMGMLRIVAARGIADCHRCAERVDMVDFRHRQIGESG